MAVRIGNVGPATVNRGLAVSKNMLGAAVREGHTKENPLNGFSVFSEVGTPPKVLILGQQKALMGCVTSSGAFAEPSSFASDGVFLEVS
jgi:hypothetical protein